MNGRNFYSHLFIWLCVCSLTTCSLAQTITTGSVTPSTICPGGAVTVSFSVSGTFAAGNTFSAQLSDATGAFSASSAVIGSVTSATAGAINATIPASTGNGSYKIRVASSSPAISSSSSAAITINAPAAPGTSSVTYCVGQAASALTATASGTLKWYSPTGTPLAVSPTPSTTAVGSTTYFVTQTVNGCESPRANLVVTVNAPPAPPTVANVDLCINGPSSQLTASGTGLKWYDAADKPLNEAPTPNTSAVGSQVFKVTQTSISGCVSDKATITVTIKPLSPAPIVTTPSPYCQGLAVQPLSATGSNLLWYGTSETGGTGTTTPTLPSTDTPGQKNYYVTQNTTGCESSRTPITVTVKAKPGLPGTSAVDFCQGSASPILAATFAANATPNWYGTNPTSGTATTTAPTPLNTTPGTTVYYVSQTVDGCESNRAGLSVRVKALPAAPGVATIGFCNNTTATQLTASAATGGTLNWYDATDKSLGEAPTPGTGTVGDQIFKVSQTVEGCEGSKANLTVTIKPLPAAPTATAPGPFCQFFQPAALTATGQNLKWYGTNATGGTVSLTAPQPATNEPGPISYYVTQTVNGCESTRAAITITIKPKPGLPGTSAIDFCQGAIPPALTATFATGATQNWYGTNPTSGTATTTAPILPNTTPGTTVYYVSQTVDGCESNRAGLNVRVKSLPAVPGVAAIGFCNNGPAAQLTASPVGGGTLNWYDASEKPLSGAPTPGTGSVGDQTFKVSQTVEGCEGTKANLVVTIKPLPNAPGVSNITYCLPTSDQPQQNVVPLTANGQSLRWYNSDGNAFPDTPTPYINQLGAQTYLVDQTVNGCTGTKATIQVIVRTTALPTVAKSLVTYCINENATPLVATAESGASLRWVNPYNQVLTEAPTPSTLNTSVKPGGDSFYAFQIGQNGCYSDRVETKVLVNALPTLSLVAPVTSVNLGQRVALQLKFTSAAPYSYTLTNGLSGVVNRSDTTLSLLPRATVTYQVVTVRNSCGVGLPGNPAAATIAVRVPTVTTSALTTSTLCAGTSLAVAFTTTGEFNQGNAFRIELVSVADTSRKYSLLTTAAASPVTAPVPLTLAGGQYYARIKADNPEIAVIGSNSPTLLTVRSQPTATLTGTQNVYEGYPANLTLTLGGDSPWAVVYADSIRSYSATATSSPYTVEVRPSRSTKYTLVSVSNGCGSGPVSGTATVTVLPLLGVDDNPLDPLVKTYPIPTTATITVELDLPLQRDPAILSITSISGQSVLQQTTRVRKHELDLTAQPSGIYLLRIQVGDRQTIRKILKQ